MAKMASLYEETTRPMATSITEDEWDQQYNPLNDSLLQDHGRDLELVMLQPKDQIWTLVEAENEKLFIRNGYHIVNRIGYYITQKPWFPSDDIVVEVR